MKTKTEPRSLDELFGGFSDLIGSAGQVRQALTDMLMHTRASIVGHRVPQHAVVWARDAIAVPGTDQPLVVPILVNLGIERAMPAATRLIEGIDRAIDTDKFAATASIVEKELGVSNELATKMMMIEAALAFLTVRAIHQSAEASRAVGVTLFGQRSVMLTGNGESITADGILVNHEHILTGSVRMWLPGVLDTDGKFVSVGEWEMMESNCNPVVESLSDLLPPSCYGKTARGVS
jgi:hypothetical protein